MSTSIADDYAAIATRMLEIENADQRPGAGDDTDTDAENRRERLCEEWMAVVLWNGRA